MAKTDGFTGAFPGGPPRVPIELTRRVLEESGAIISAEELREQADRADEARKRRVILGRYTAEEQARIVRSRSCTAAVLDAQNGNNGSPQLYE